MEIVDKIRGTAAVVGSVSAVTPTGLATFQVSTPNWVVRGRAKGNELTPPPKNIHHYVPLN